ncbi:MAG: metal dependent phosphohydrolase [candidate division WS6 bacterium GW2011_GWF2_39_15]|uniref:Ribonuclease Y n=1 Tax=candidate division WS6 bacterium GW2011_GWF2_39_15 TaxID=1619100 RepID=A0A0G0Q5J5_9BACT|nr:MAG: metal dependent phosphohydrolase [candidate division WS6 bacterium GW2011_GWF2_39_15]
MEAVIALIAALTAAGGTFAVLKFGMKWVNVKNIPEEVILETANKKFADRISKVNEEEEALRRDTDERIKKARKEFMEQEALLIEREKKLNGRAKMLDEKSEELVKESEEVKNMQKGLEISRAKLKTELEKISGLTRDEATKKLMKEVESDMADYEAQLIRKAEKKAEEVSEEKAKEILVEAMQKVETDYVGETTTTSVKIEDDKVKGRIIGKEGRNIRAFEKATGVDVIVDDSPTTIGLSSFDPLRREIARVSLTKLVGDGRIHPGSIEEAIRKAKNEIAVEIKKNGQVLAEEAGWPGIDIGLLKLIGKMKYRTSYGQTLMSHVIEVIRIGAALATEMKADVDLVKKACLLHDVGKVLSHKLDIPHHHISGQIARKYGLDDKLVNAIEAHHLDIEPTSVEAMIVHIADAISGARPGARKDSYEQYVKRIEGIENAAKEVGGDKIHEVFAIRAGRELRVIVDPNTTNDSEIKVLAKKIAENIQKTQNYPGNVEVSVIRESRAVEVAR